MAFLPSSPGRTDAGEFTQLEAPNMSFSVAYPSPSKDPKNDLLSQMRSKRSGGSHSLLRTPNTRNALGNLRNPSAKPEFTPLLKSAARNRLMSLDLNDKENTFGMRNGVPETPAAMRPGYQSHTPALPMNSSMIDGEHTTSSAELEGGSTPGPPVESSSAMSTPIPALPKRGEAGVLEQGTVLTLREQEAKIALIDKENFGLKLKIHFLEENLKRTGSEHQQAIVRDNAELQTERLQLMREIKLHQKSLRNAEKQLEESRREFVEYVEKVKRRHADEHTREEMDRLKTLAMESQHIADEKEAEILTLQKKLQGATKGQDEETEKLRDHISDLEAEIRERELELDGKDERLEALQEKLQDAQTDIENSKALQEDVDDLEAELKEKDQAITSKDQEIEALKQRLNHAHDRDRSTKKLRGDVDDLENQLRIKDHAIDEKHEQLRATEKRIQSVESASAAELRQKDFDLQEKERLLEAKDGEVQALQERLQTARGSWDAEAQQTDARLHEKDRLLQEKESRLREMTRIVEERDVELRDLQKKLETAQGDLDELSRTQGKQLQQHNDQLQAMQDKMRMAASQSDTEVQEKDMLIQQQATELRALQTQLQTTESSQHAELRLKTEHIADLEKTLHSKSSALKDAQNQLALLQGRLAAVETPSKSKNLLEQQAKQIRELQQQLQRLEDEKEAECEGLEQQLQAVESEKQKHFAKVQQLQERLRTVEKDQSFAGHLDQDLQEKQKVIEDLEDRLHGLQQDIRNVGQEKDMELRALERELQTAQADATKSTEELQRVKNEVSAGAEAKYAATIQALEDEVIVLETSLDDAQAETATLQTSIRKLEADLENARLAKDNGTPARERNELRLRLKNADLERANLKMQIKDLEHELSIAWKAKETGTPARERNEVRIQLRESQRLVGHLQSQVQVLESELDAVRQERTIAEERKDLHDLVKEAKLEAEDLQLKVADRDRKVAASARKEFELRNQLHSTKAEFEEAQIQVQERESRINACMAKEQELRSQLKELRDAKIQVEDLEMQLGERKGSSSGHARREAELRTQLRDAKIELEELQFRVQERDDQIQIRMRKERELREQMRINRTKPGETLLLQEENLHARLADVELELQDLQAQLLERESRLESSLRREEELRSKLKIARLDANDTRALTQKETRALLEGSEKTHASELKGLAKQIQYLRAKCGREEAFRQDLVFMKRWFLMQVEMYGACNKADLRLLEEMGITPDRTVREKRPTLRTTGWMIIASLRMQRMASQWAGSKKLHESLLKKLEMMRRGQGKRVV
ncbi:hypothetical protein LTR66_007267 [Elasticomyces elasticus]|nr:hypothetical protein LTR66_007267 [Elasticomyces elasticus]